MSLHPPHPWYLTPKSCQSHNQGHKFPSWVTVLPIHLVEHYKCVQALSETQCWRSPFLGLMAGSSGITIALSDWKLITCSSSSLVKPSPLLFQLCCPGLGRLQVLPKEQQRWAMLSNTSEHGNCHPKASIPSLAKPELLRKEAKEQLLWGSIISLRLIIYILFISYGTLTVTLKNIIW